MPTFRGISVFLQSQYDGLTLPEYPPPATLTTPPKKTRDDKVTCTFKASTSSVESPRP